MADRLSRRIQRRTDPDPARLRRRGYHHVRRAKELGLSVVPRSTGEIWSFTDTFDCVCMREYHGPSDIYTVVGQNTDQNIHARIIHQGAFHDLPKNWFVL